MGFDSMNFGFTSSEGVGGGGTVTTFSSGDLSPLFTTSVATASTTPALSFTAVNQAANLVYASPAAGGAAAPTFRSLVNADLPVVDYQHGGTGLSTLGTPFQSLRVNAGATALEYYTPFSISGLTQYYVTMGGAGGTSVTDGTWFFPAGGNAIAPVTDGSNIGLTGTNRVGTIFMASTIDYAANLIFSENGSEKARFLTGGNFGVGTNSPSAKIHVIGTGNTNATFGLKIVDNGSNINFYVDDSGTVNSRLAYWLTGNEFIHQTGDPTNTYVGVLCGLNTHAGTVDNAGFGNRALQAVTTGTENCAFGTEALQGITVAVNNCAFGWSALQSNIIGNSNCAFGLFSLSNTLVNNNIAMGFQSGNINTTGTGNTFLGYNTNNTAGTESYSIALGFNAKITADQQFVVGSAAAPILNAYIGTSVASPNANLFIGAIGINTTSIASTVATIKGTGSSNATYSLKVLDSSANINFYIRDDGAVDSRLGYWLNDNEFIHQTNSNENVYVGLNCGLSSSGATNQNAGFGTMALQSNTSGAGNSAFGFRAAQSNTTASNTTAFGYYACNHVTTANDNTAFGQSALSGTTSGGANTAIGSFSGKNNTTGARNIFIGYQAGCTAGSEDQTVAIGYQATTTASFQVVFGSPAGNLLDYYFGLGVSVNNNLTGNPLTFNATSVSAGYTDGNADNWTFKGGVGTGTGVGSDFIWQVAPASGSTGSTQNALVEVFRLKHNRTLQYTDGNQGLGKVLTSDASGIGTWQTPNVYAPAPATGTYSGSTITLTAGENLAFGDVVYIKSDGKAWKANATDNTKGVAVGIATGTIGTGTTGIILLQGTITLSSWTWTVGSTSQLYLSTSDGVMTQTKPSASNNIVQALAWPLSATTIFFNPSEDYVTIV